MMAVDGLLKRMADQVIGYIAGVFSASDGTIIAGDTRKDLDLKGTNTHMTELIGMGGGELEDVLMTTTRHFVLIKYLPGKAYFLGIIVDRKTANLGQVRLMSNLYSEKLARCLAK